MPQLALSLAWLGGIAVGSWSITSLLLGLALGIVLIVLVRVRLRNGSVAPRLALLSFCLLVGLLATFRYQHHDSGLSLDPLATVDEQATVHLRGVIADDPEVRDVTARWTLEVDAIALGDDGEWEEQGGKVLVSTRWLPALSYGDQVTLTGKLERAPRFENFDYREYLRYQGVHRLMRYPKVEAQEGNRGSPFFTLIYATRHGLTRGIEQALPEPQSALTQGIVLGVRSAIPAAIEEDFRKTGTTHILAISGHNLSVVAGLVALIGIRLFGRSSPLFLGLVLFATWGYAALAGFEPSVQRAAIMASLVLLAVVAGRWVFLPLSLALSAVIMTLWDPFLFWDLGFQLSILSLTGMLAMSTLLMQLTERLRPPDGYAMPLRIVGLFVGLPFAATLGASLATLPVQAINFGLVPLVALPTTLLALPALPGILLGGMISALAGLVAPGVAGLVALPTWFSASFMLLVVQIGAALPGAAVETPPIHPVWGIVYLAALSAALWAVHRWLQQRSAVDRAQAQGADLGLLFRWWPSSRAETVAWALVALLLLYTGLLWSSNHDEVRITFLDVGQGDAMLLQTSQGQQVLIDGGPGPAALLQELGTSLSLLDRTIEVIVLTHPDRDHLTGLLEVVRRYNVGVVLEGPATSETPEYRQWAAELDQRGIRRLRAVAGVRLSLKDVEIEVLHPPVGFEPSPNAVANHSSLVLKVSAHGQSVLLTGDIEAPQEVLLLLERHQLPSSVLKVAHHGSNTSSTEDFIAAVNPAVAVISVGADNRFGHPTAAVLERISPIRVLRTDKDGSIEMRLNEEGIAIRGTRPRTLE